MAISSSSMHNYGFDLNSYDRINRQCWICNRNQDNLSHTDWIIACKCTTSKWIHKNCLEEFIDKKQRGNIWVRVLCPHCGFRYVILYPNSGLMVKIFDLVDEIISLASPFVAGVYAVYIVYATAVLHGGITYMQIVGWKQGSRDIWRNLGLSLVGLPIIPTTLVLSRYIKWQDMVINALPPVTRTTTNTQRPQGKTSIIFIRTICGALLVPTMSQIFGQIFFGHIESKFKRVIFGGLAYIGVKGILKIYYKRSMIARQLERDIKNYDHHE